MPRVFIAHARKNTDFSAAIKFGTLTVLSGRETFPDTAASVYQIMDHIRYRLADFNPSDHLLLSGDPVSIACAIFALRDMGITSINMLKYDRQSRDYYRVTIR